jgi:IS1 family transposase
MPLLTPFDIKVAYSGNNSAYQSCITNSEAVTGKEKTQKIERKHLSLRARCSRLVRKGIRFSKTVVCIKSLRLSFLIFGFFRELFDKQYLSPTTGKV